MKAVELAVEKARMGAHSTGQSAERAAEDTLDGALTKIVGEMKAAGKEGVRRRWHRHTWAD